MLLGNGFYDPYSAYIRVEVSCTLTDMQPAAGNYCGRFFDRSAHSLFGRLVIKSQGTELERVEQYDVLAGMIQDMLYSQEQVELHHYEGMPMNDVDIGGTLLGNPQATTGNPNLQGIAGLPYLQALSQPPHLRNIADQGFWVANLATDASSTYTTCGMGPLQSANLLQAPSGGISLPFSNLIGSSTTIAAGRRTSPSTLIFCLPIYSGIIGVLMPDKKMIPLSLMPLEVEFTINPYALYCAGAVGSDSNPRDFTINKMWLYSHMLFFEQELHRSLEAVVAENGIFIHFNSFYLAPITTHVGTAITPYAQINIHAKSINSVHFVFIYTGFEALAGNRKLNFVNHNLTFLQIRNGTELTPSEAIQGDQLVQKQNGAHVQFLLETYKAWNKMHDPTTDCAINGFNFSQDGYSAQTDTATLMGLFHQQARLGRCQYAISLEGEELGQDKTIITGRKGLIPFDINFNGGTKSYNINSFQFTFVKADYIVYVRPDLVVTILGR